MAKLLRSPWPSCVCFILFLILLFFGYKQEAAILYCTGQLDLVAIWWILSPIYEERQTGRASGHEMVMFIGGMFVGLLGAFFTGCFLIAIVSQLLR